MELFRELHRARGLTVIFVTHDPTIAANAQRVIHIQDGQIA
jgi:putative ABC transport system ATP-binding protein